MEVAGDKDPETDVFGKNARRTISFAEASCSCKDAPMFREVVPESTLKADIIVKWGLRTWV